MGWEGDKYRRVIVPLKSRLHLEEIKSLASLFRGEYQGEQGDKIQIFDFDSKQGAEMFKEELSQRFGKWLSPGVRSYSDWEYD